MEEQLKDEEESDGGVWVGGWGGRLLWVRIGSHRQPEVLLVFAVHSQSEVLVAGLRQSVLFVQDVQDSHQLGLHQVWRKSGRREPLTTFSQADMMCVTPGRLSQQRPHRRIIAHLIGNIIELLETAL